MLQYINQKEVFNMQTIVTDEAMPSATIKIKGAEKPIVVTGLNSEAAEKAVRALFSHESILTQALEFNGYSLEAKAKRGRPKKVNSGSPQEAN